MKTNKSLFRRFTTIYLMLFFLFIFLFLMTQNVEHTNSEKDSFTYSYYGIVLFFTVILIIFGSVLWFFFFRLQKRLVLLQETMQISASHQTFPNKIPVDKERMDEIDQLGSSFNWMVEQLRYSRSRELKEESLRKDLITNLSHDLRTPLTIMRGQLSQLQKEQLTIDAQETVKEIDTTITRVSDLADDLLAYTLVTSGKYPYNSSNTDIVRLVRGHVANWYLLFEEEEFVFNFEVSAENIFYWKIDPGWLKRILDNFFQNILRHANDGKFAKVSIDTKQEHIVITDHGPGMQASNDTKGVGIGLTLSTYMLEKMNLEANFQTNNKGTQITIYKQNN